VQLYGHIIGIYRRGRKVGRGRKEKEGEEKGSRKEV